MVSTSHANWPKKTSRPSQLSKITVIKKQQYRDCGQKVISIRIGRVFLNNLLISMQSDDIFLPIVFGTKSNGKSNGYLTQDLVATP